MTVTVALALVIVSLTVPEEGAEGRLDAWLASQVAELSRSRLQAGPRR